MAAEAAVLANCEVEGKSAEAGQLLRLVRLVRLWFPQQRSSSPALDIRGKLRPAVVIGRRNAGQQQYLLLRPSCSCA